MCDIVLMSGRSPTFYCLLDPVSFDICRSGPVLSGTGSIVTTGVGAGGNREDGLWDRPPKRSSSSQASNGSLPSSSLTPLAD